MSSMSYAVAFQNQPYPVTSGLRRGLNHQLGHGSESVSSSTIADMFKSGTSSSAAPVSERTSLFSRFTQGLKRLFSFGSTFA